MVSFFKFATIQYLEQTPNVPGLSSELWPSIYVKIFWRHRACQNYSPGATLIIHLSQLCRREGREMFFPDSARAMVKICCMIRTSSELGHAY